MLFNKNSRDYVFRKGSTGNTLFRKGLNTFGNVAKNFMTVSDLATKLSPVVTGFNPAVGAIVGEAGVLGKSLGNTINDLVSSGKQFKKSIERA
jgi:hypothetical protein